MPKIPEYIPEVGAPGMPPTRNATAIDFGGDGVENLGRSIQGTAGVLHEKASQDDVTNVRVAMAKARAEWDVNFRDRANGATPGDPTFADKFKQDFTDYIGKSRDIAQTRDGQRTFDLLSAELTGHFTEKAGLFQVQSAGIKAKNDWDVSQRAYATSIVTDPTSYGAVLGQAIAELRDPKGQYGRLPNDARQQLETKARDTMAQAYINGLVDNGAPELARKLLMDGKLDDQLEPKDKQRLVHAADAGITAKRVAAEHADALARREEKKAVDATNDVLMGKFIDGKLTMGDVRASGLPTFGEGSQNTWVTMLRTQAKEWAEKPIKTNPTVMLDAFTSINLPAGDPKKITSMSEINNLYTKGYVSWADLSHLRSEFQNQQTAEGQRLGTVKSDFMKGIKAQLDKSTMNRLDEAGGERMFRYTVYVNEQIDAARKANKDPYQLFNPNSPEYVGKSIPQFQSGPQRTQVDLAKRIDASLNKAGRKSLDDIFRKPAP
jgi:hypothetical protein